MSASLLTNRERRWEKSRIVERSVRIVGSGFCMICGSFFGVVNCMYVCGGGDVVFVSSCVNCLVYKGVTIVVFLLTFVESSLYELVYSLLVDSVDSVDVRLLSELVDVIKLVDFVLLVLLLSVREINEVKLGEAFVKI